MQMREGDLIKTKADIVFDVKGLVHPLGKVIAFPRFIPESFGSRGQKVKNYKKVYALSARFNFLEENFPHYIVHDPVFDEKLCEVPLEDVKCHYKPVNRLRVLRSNEQLDELERDALAFIALLKDNAKVSWSEIGISGSLLVRLHRADSDIDPVVYGSENCYKVYEALKTLTQEAESPPKAYSMKELRKLFHFRVKDTQMPFKNFVKTESRKVLQGKFKNRDYFMRFVKNWKETRTEYGAVHYRNVGYMKIRALIEDDSEAIFTPCSYKIKNVDILEGIHFPIEEVTSFRGRFCEQAKTGEVIIAQGKVERVIDKRQNREYFRLLLGNKTSDYMILA